MSIKQIILKEYLEKSGYKYVFHGTENEFSIEYPDFQYIHVGGVKTAYHIKSTAYNEIYTDVKDFITDTPLEHKSNMDYEVEILYTDKLDPVSAIQEHDYYVGGTINTLLKMAINVPDTYYFEDYINEFSFKDKFYPARYGYPIAGADKETVSDYIDQVEELVVL